MATKRHSGSLVHEDLHEIKHTLHHITHTLEKIMANNEQLLAQYNELKTTLADVGTGIDKIGTETDTLITKISELEAAIENGGQTSPEVDEAFAGVKAVAESLKAKVTAVDSKVPDSV